MFSFPLILLLFCYNIEVYAVGLSSELYCGLENCYDVLGIDRDNFDRSTLSKLYRVKAKQYHPDRYKGKEDQKEAEDRFRVVGTAYETLRDNDTRTEYDYYLDHPEERFYNYYQYYRRQTVTKIPVWPVVLGSILLISLVQYLSARLKYAEAVNYIVTSGKFRHRAIEVAVERNLVQLDKSGKLKKVKGQDNEAILRTIVEENMDVKGGYARPEFRRLICFQIAFAPIHLFNYIRWQVDWQWRFRIRNEPLDDEAKLYLFRRLLGASEAQVEAMSEKEIDEVMRLKLWEKENFDPWKSAKSEDEKAKQMQSGKYKQYKRYMKNNNDTMSFLED